MPGNIDKSKLHYLACLATDASVTRYQTVEQNIVKTKGYLWSLFCQPMPSQKEVFSSTAYQEDNLETTQLRYKKFEDELYLAVLALNKDIELSKDNGIKAVQEDSIREAIEKMYQHVFLNNKGSYPLYDDFYEKIRIFLGNPGLNELDTPAKMKLVSAGLGGLCLAAAIGCSFLSVSFTSIILPLVIAGFAALGAALMFTAAQNIYNRSVFKNDNYILPPEPTTPTPSSHGMFKEVVTPVEVWYNNSPQDSSQVLIYGTVKLL